MQATSILTQTRTASREATSTVCQRGALGYLPELGPLSSVVDAFIRSRRAANCSAATIRIYSANLARFQKTSGAAMLADVNGGIVERHLNILGQQMKPVSVHQHVRTLRTFFRWCVQVGYLRHGDPMASITFKAPRTLPTVPSDEDVRRLLAVCEDTFEGRRNKALIHVLADSGLRKSEALRLRIEDVNFAERSFTIRRGKGGKDRVSPFGEETARALRRWFKMRQQTALEDYLFTDREGQPLSSTYATHLLHRLSKRAGLDRKIGPHALRHYAATTIVKETGDIELVRQVLGHETLAMSLRYTHLAQVEVSRKFRRASPMDNLKAAG